ncbi:hypothetical protein [Ensifer aridi]|uniref:hypothetical protein n=1 Tax=Ensifer aridi TaxID=1708715 RepID=UPI001FCE0786|nr:hypothetical protein [Ensifer aridi]
MDRPHRLAQYLAPLMHESGDFRYDRELWDPTPAQQRYDTRTDLGNTPQKDGDGYLYCGRTGMQLTGKDNYRQFRDWCRTAGLDCPTRQGSGSGQWEWCPCSTGTPAAQPLGPATPRPSRRRSTAARTVWLIG